MTKYALIYHGEPGMPETPEEMEQVMAAWNEWFGSLGEAVVDGGNPFGPSKLITSGGAVTDATTALSGYSLINADSLDDAIAKAKGCPVLAHGNVQVCEAIDM